MEDHEGLHHKPLQGKCFFIDPKVDKSLAEKLKQNLILLGGVSNILYIMYLVSSFCIQ